MMVKVNQQVAIVAAGNGSCRPSCRHSSRWFPALTTHAAYFAEAEARLLGERLWHLVQQMVATPDAPVESLALLPPAEKTLLLETLQCERFIWQVV